MRIALSIVLIGVGVFLWFWGSFQLSGKKGYLYKIHAMGASDTIGTLFILSGALLHSLENWPHIVLAMGAVAFWGTAFSFVLARLGKERDGGDGE